MSISRSTRLAPGLLAGLLCFTGCGKKDDSENKGPVQPKQMPKVESINPTASENTAPPDPDSAAAGATQAQPMTAVVAEQPDAKATVEKEAFETVFARMNMLSGEYYIEHKVALKSIDQLVALGRIAAIPAPPAGKVYSIDSSNGRLSLKRK